ncbi:MAG: cell division protein ZapE [Sulfuriferula sp.]|nr:cell division protein ZapE [Sulfuriferula sp.]
MQAPVSSDIKHYLQQQADARGWVLDEAQLTVLADCQRLYDELTATHYTGWQWWRTLMPTKHVRGLYIWGEVGRGKSLIMDALFNCVPVSAKRRVHFHHFMQEIHATLAKMQGQKNPLDSLSKQLSQQFRLLCLDEFYITDIADAMLMQGLLRGLIAHGVVLVMTSNSEPEKLYQHGLQRQQFLPCIALMQQNLTVSRLDGARDYRRVLNQPACLNTLMTVFVTLSQAETQARQQNAVITIHHRRIQTRYIQGGVIWLAFDEICGNYRSKADYLALAVLFHTVLISDVPQFNTHLSAQARRFLWLVDALYDAQVKLLISAPVTLNQLAPAHLLAGEFDRTLSRLAEMQTVQVDGCTHEKAPRQ